MASVHLVHKQNASDYERIRPQMQRVVDKATHGEFDAEDLGDLIKEGKAYAAYVAEDDGRVRIAAVWELVFYRKRTAINLIAMGGERFYESIPSFYEGVKAAWRQQGADCVECLTSPAMARFLQRAGFKEIYRFSRMELNDESEH